MTEQTWWLVGVAAVLAAAVIGFFVGRNSGGARKRVEVLEAELSRQQDELSDYRREVESHFDQTATLFGSLAGSYKELFEHLSSGYEKLSGGSSRQLFMGKVGGLLLGGAGMAAAAGDGSSAFADDDPLDTGNADDSPVEEPGQSAEATEAEAGEASVTADAEPRLAAGDAPVQQPETTGDEASSTPGAETQPDGAEKPLPETQAEAAAKTPGEPEGDDGEPSAGKGDKTDKI